MTDEEPTRYRKTVAVDFDGPLHAYTRGWQDGVIYDEPTPGALESVRALAQEYRVVVFTARTDLGPVWQWLVDKGFRDAGVEKVTNNKPPAQVYIDDRAVYFDTSSDNPWGFAYEDALAVIAHHEQRVARGPGA